jgi:hypothetical protein
VLSAGRRRARVVASNYTTVSRPAAVLVGLFRSPGFRRDLGADFEHVAVGHMDSSRVIVFTRSSGRAISMFGVTDALLRGSDAYLGMVHTLHFFQDGRYVACADDCAVKVFRVADGAFQRCIGTGVLRIPASIASTSFGELLVAYRNDRIVIFDAYGHEIMSFGERFQYNCPAWMHIAVRNNAVYAKCAQYVRSSSVVTFV